MDALDPLDPINPWSTGVNLTTEGLGFRQNRLYRETVDIWRPVEHRTTILGKPQSTSYTRVYRNIPCYIQTSVSYQQVDDSFTFDEPSNPTRHDRIELFYFAWQLDVKPGDVMIRVSPELLNNAPIVWQARSFPTVKNWRGHYSIVNSFRLVNIPSGIPL